MRWGIAIAILFLAALALSCSQDEAPGNQTPAITAPADPAPAGNTTPSTARPINRPNDTIETPRLDTAKLSAYCTLLGGEAGEQCAFSGKSCDLWKLYVGECVPPFVDEQNEKAEAFITEKLGLTPQHVKSIAINRSVIHAVYSVKNSTIIMTITDGTITQALRFGPLFPPMDYTKSDPRYEIGAPARGPQPAMKIITAPGETCGTSAHYICHIGTCVWSSRDSGACT